MKKIFFILVLFFGSINISNSEINRIVAGNKDAKITIITYESLTCSHCADFHKDIYPQLKKDYIDTGLAKIEFRHFPLDVAAFNASKVSQCKSDQSLEILESLYSNQQEWVKGNTVEEINNNLNYKDLDYVFVSDFDGTNKLINEEAILSCFLSTNNWDACTANQKGPYYDIWALRHSILGPNDCYEEYSFYRSCGLSEERSKNLAIYSKMITISQSSNWIEVDSAFGGLVIYKKSLFLENEYRGLTCQGDEICEHVYFHRLIRSKGANIYINPRLINTDFNEHSLQTTFKFKLFRIAWRIFTLSLKSIISKEKMTKIKGKILKFFVK